MKISDIHNPWRDRLVPASFRGNQFFVEQSARASGRRVALHEYPKRNEPYAEDMGRRARRWQIQAYLIGPVYHIHRDILITALEADGPGTLILPLAYLGQPVEAMVGAYTVNESRERGGFCVFDIEFIERGRPGFSTTPVDTRSTINDAAKEVETTTKKAAEPEQAST